MTATWRHRAQGVVALVPAALHLWGPGASVAGVIVAALALAVAFHGFGRLVGRLAGDPDAPLALAVAWGVSAYLAVGGVLIALHLAGPGARIALIVLGGALTGLRIADLGPLKGPRRRLARPSPGAAVAGLIAAAVIGLVIVAAAGRWTWPQRDAETDYAGEIRRLDDTGALDDAVGFPRALGLGGAIVLAAGTSPLDPRTGGLVDRGLGFALVVLLAVDAGRRRGRASRAPAVIAGCLPIVLSAVPDYLAGPTPLWSVVALVLAAIATLERAARKGLSGLLPTAVLVAAGAAALRHHVVPVAVATTASAVAIAGTLGARRWAARWLPLAALGALIGYVVALVVARADGALAVARPRGAVVGVALGVAALGGVLTAVGLPKGPCRAVVLGGWAAVGLAGVFAPNLVALGPELIPLVLGLLLAIVLDRLLAIPPLAPSTAPLAGLGAASVLVTAVLGLVALARFAPGDPILGWSPKLAQMIDDARALGRVVDGPRSALAARYARAQDAVPAGTRLGIWVARADLVRFDAHEVTDLGASRLAPRAEVPLALDCILVDRAADPPTRAVAALIARGRVIYDADGLTGYQLTGAP